MADARGVQGGHCATPADISRAINSDWIGKGAMAHGAWPQLFHLGRQTVCALAVLVAVLAIGLAQPGHVADRGGVPSLEAHDAYAKALRPLPQLAYRGQSRSARLGSSVGAEP